MSKILRAGGFILFGIILILIFFGNKIIENIIFRPAKIEQSYVFKFNKPFKEFYVETDSGIRINVVRFPAKKAKGSLLYFHGNKDNLIRWGKIASQFTEYQYNSYVFDYRGYGKSSGMPSEESILKDSEVIFEKINQLYPDSCWIYFGRSLGSGVAAYLSSRYTPNGLILESPYYSMEELIGRFYFPYTWYSQFVSLPSYAFLKDSSFPLLILHGDYDQVVPVESGLKLFYTIKNPSKKIVIIKHGTHDNLSEYAEYQKAIYGFLNK